MSNYNLKVLSEKYNPLIKRKEIYLLVEHTGKGTPSKKEVRESISKLYNKDLNTVYILKISTVFGSNTSKALVHIYDDPKRGERIEPKYILIRNNPKLKKKGEK